VATALALTAGLYLALIYAPEDRFQGIAQRIFYVHVPVAWVGFLAFFVVFVASLGYLWTRRTGWDIIARSSAEMGTVFMTCAVISGSIWARPIWNTWWSWDARGTTTLILWLIYISYLMLRSTGDLGPRTARLASVLGIFGFLNVPLVFMATRWWNTLHPKPTVITGDPDAGLAPEMLLALIVSLLAFTLLYALLMVHRIRWDSARDRLLRLRAELDV
jgi:heme exporter protein C